MKKMEIECLTISEIRAFNWNADSFSVQALKHTPGKFATKLTSDVISELQQWLDISDHSSKAIKPRLVDKICV